jgi:hypothetical protein
VNASEVITITITIGSVLILGVVGLVLKYLIDRRKP